MKLGEIDYDVGTDSYWICLPKGVTPLPDYIRGLANGWIKEKDGKILRSLAEVRTLDPITGIMKREFALAGTDEIIAENLS